MHYKNGCGVGPEKMGYQLCQKTGNARWETFAKGAKETVIPSDGSKDTPGRADGLVRTNSHKKCWGIW